MKRQQSMPTLCYPEAMPTKRVSQTALLVSLAPASNLPVEGEPHLNNIFASFKFYVTRHCRSPQKSP